MLSEIKDSMKSEFSSLNSRLTSLESKGLGDASSTPRVEAPPPNHLVSSPEEAEAEGDDNLSMAPGSQERLFLEDDVGEASLHKSQDSTHTSELKTESHVGEEIEVSDVNASLISKEVLWARVYTLMRDVANVPFASPPRVQKLKSNFEASCGLAADNKPIYGSFPESNHTISALRIVNESLSNESLQSSAQLSGFSPSSFPGVFLVKDYQVYNSTLGRIVPTCDKSMSNLLGSKPCDSLRLSQALWSKSENLLRNSSLVLGHADHYLAASGSLLQDLDGEGIPEIKAFLLQLDKALGASQSLILGTLANFTLAKRLEMLDKSTVSESLKDSLLRSPISSKIFGLSLEKVQEEAALFFHFFPFFSDFLEAPLQGCSEETESALGHCPFVICQPLPGRKKFLCHIFLWEGGWPIFLDQWEKITTDPWVLLIIRGIGSSIQEATTSVSLSYPIYNFSRSSQDSASGFRGINAVTESTIELVSRTALDPGFYSRIFLVPKKTGGMRPVIDLSVLNTYLIIPHFKTETNRSIRASILPGMWATSLDLADAYFHCPIAPTFRRYLRFAGATRYSLLKEFSPVNLSSHTHIVIELFLRIGFMISWEKSDRIPSQNFIFLGEHYRTDLGLVFPTEIKFLSLCKFIQFSLKEPFLTARQFSQLLGLLNSLADVVPLGRLHIRPIQYYLFEHWLPASQDWEAQIPVLDPLKPHLFWWTYRENVLKGVPLLTDSPSLTLYTDSSSLGWGAYLNGLTASGQWSSQLQREHINVLEMKAVCLALSHFRESLSNKSVVLATDNSTVVAYLENQGGTCSFPLFQLARDILLFCAQHQIVLVVRHIPGHLNLLADSLSRSLAPVNTEWELHRSVFQSVVLHWGKPNIDLFATSLNFKIQTFVSPVPDPRAYAVDAMAMSWEGMFGYAFPPFRFLAPVLKKIERERCRIIVIAPAWPKQAWFPDLLCLSCANPLVLPLKHNLLSQFKGRVLHQSPGFLHLHTWLLSGITSDRRVFLNQLPCISPGQFENPLAAFMTPNALASGRRRSEIHALSISDSCLRFTRNRSSVTLLTDPAFLGKNQIPDKGATHIVIPALPDNSDSLALCPVRILTAYLSISSTIRSGNTRLFIPIKRGVSDLSAPPSIYYIPNFITKDEEEILIHHVNTAPRPKWTQLSNRRLQNWGGLPHPKGMIAEDLPHWLQIYAEKIAGLGVFEDKIPNHVLVNEYRAGQGIMPHEDGSLFYPTVSTISLGSHSMLEFYHHLSLHDDSSEAGDTKKSTIEDRYLLSMLLEPRSLVLVCDEMYKVHLHGISEKNSDIVTDKVANIDVCEMANLGDTLHRETRISLTIRYVPKILKNKLFFGKR
ncbi:hypothetical protein ScPMuIL_013813 [Solemya velum]